MICLACYYHILCFILNLLPWYGLPLQLLIILYNETVIHFSCEQGAVKSDQRSYFPALKATITAKAKIINPKINQGDILPACKITEYDTVWRHTT